MPRVARILLENCCYHVITRGNQKQYIFPQEQDNEVFLKLLAKYKIKYKLKLYGYCLMKNHVHLILNIRRSKDLGKFMQCLNLSYAIWFNKKYKKTGHLWQGRFKSMIVSKNQYLIDCLNYVELNPVRANLVQNPNEYKWSSYTSRILGKENKLLDILDIV